MASSEKHFIRRVAIALSILYLVLVPVFAALKVTTSLLRTISWPELVYGPAITIGCSFVLIHAAVWIECRIRKRA